MRVSMLNAQDVSRTACVAAAALTVACAQPGRRETGEAALPATAAAATSTRPGSEQAGVQAPTANETTAAGAAGSTVATGAAPDAAAPAASPASGAAPEAAGVTGSARAPRVHRPEPPAPGTDAPGGAAAAADPGDAQVNQFVSYNANKKTVSIKLYAALNSAQGGFNFNGGSSGNQTITVPLGWAIHFDVTNTDAIPHSAILIVNQSPIPNAPSNPAFPRAFPWFATARYWEDHYRSLDEQLGQLAAPTLEL